MKITMLSSQKTFHDGVTETTLEKGETYVVGEGNLTQRIADMLLDDGTAEVTGKPASKNDEDKKTGPSEHK